MSAPTAEQMARAMNMHPACNGYCRGETHAAVVSVRGAGSGAGRWLPRWTAITQGEFGIEVAEVRLAREYRPVPGAEDGEHWLLVFRAPGFPAREEGP